MNLVCLRVAYDVACPLRLITFDVTFDSDAPSGRPAVHQRHRLTCVHPCSRVCTCQAKDNRKVDLLTSLCSCNGKAIISNQESITKLLFSRTNGELYLPMKLDKDVVLVLPTIEFFPSASYRRWVDIRVFFAEADIHLFRSVLGLLNTVDAAHVHTYTYIHTYIHTYVRTSHCNRYFLFVIQVLRRAAPPVCGAVLRAQSAGHRRVRKVLPRERAAVHFGDGEPLPTGIQMFCWLFVCLYVCLFYGCWDLWVPALEGETLLPAAGRCLDGPA